MRDFIYCARHSFSLMASLVTIFLYSLLMIPVILFLTKNDWQVWLCLISLSSFNCFFVIYGIGGTLEVYRGFCHGKRLLAGENPIPCSDSGCFDNGTRLAYKYFEAKRLGGN